MKGEIYRRVRPDNGYDRDFLELTISLACDPNLVSTNEESAANLRRVRENSITLDRFRRNFAAMMLDPTETFAEKEAEYVVGVGRRHDDEAARRFLEWVWEAATGESWDSVKAAQYTR